MPTSAELHERRVAAVPRGIGHATAIYAKRAKNAEIWSEDGKRYIDFAAGIAVVNTGHQHPKIVAAVEEQLKAFSHVCFQVTPYETYVRLAERLNAIAPVAGPAKTMLVSTGAEAVENAVKVARAFTGRPGIVSFSGGFHGRTHMGMALTGKVVPYKKGFGPFPADVYNVAFPNVYHGVSGEQSLAALKALFKYTADPSSIAAIIIEPVQGEGGFNIAPFDFLRALAGAVRRARHPADRRRDSNRLCAHRQNVRAGACRRQGRCRDDGQGTGRRLSAVRHHRARRCDGCVESRRSRRHLCRQSGGLRRRPCRARRDRGGKTLRPRQRHRQDHSGPLQSDQRALQPQLRRRCARPRRHVRHRAGEGRGERRAGAATDPGLDEGRKRERADSAVLRHLRQRHPLPRAADRERRSWFARAWTSSRRASPKP